PLEESFGSGHARAVVGHVAVPSEVPAVRVGRPAAVLEAFPPGGVHGLHQAVHPVVPEAVAHLPATAQVDARLVATAPARAAVAVPGGLADEEVCGDGSVWRGLQRAFASEERVRVPAAVVLVLAIARHRCTPPSP